MKISLNWLKQYVNIPVSDEELVRLIGARLVEVEGVIDETHKYDKIFVVRVESAEKIPDTHLTKCMINVGDAVKGLAKVETNEVGLVQVMCGAPNVHEGMLAAWIAPGAIVPASVHEDAPFVIGKRKMLGQYDSYGMLAGADELDFGDDHSGIVEIDPEMAKPGDLLADVFKLNDLILEIENKSLTHRPDCFGLIGFAREVAGILKAPFEDAEKTTFGDGSLAPVVTGLGPFILGRNLRTPQKLSFPASNAVKISISKSEDICERYTAVVLEKHGEIKKKYLSFVDTILAKSGMRPIDPIVDSTNYLMLLTGQPLHAFDYDKFVAVGGSEKPEIGVRLARAGEKIILLDDSEIELNENDIVICSNDKPVALAGAMGGKNTEIDENTKNIIIEAATFSLYNLRKTQMAHGIFSEAITRFTKGQPAYQTMTVAKACADMLKDGFKMVSVADEYPGKTKIETVEVAVSEINGLLGTNYTTNEIVETLENVGFEVEVTEKRKFAIEIKIELKSKKDLDDENDGVLIVTVPEWRTDIHIKEDVIEEIGRLNGYDNIKPTLPLHASASRNEMFDLKREIRETLAKFGANELLTYSFISEKLLEKAGQEPKNSYKIINSISPELQYVRQSIVPSLLEKTYMNEKLPVEKFAIFEMNKVYQKTWGETDEKVPVEKTHLGFVVAERKNNGTAYYKAKKYVDELLKHFNIQAEYVPIKSSNAEAKPFEPKRTAEIMINGDVIGVVGEFKNSVKHEFKLAEYVAGAEIDIEKILQYKTRKTGIGAVQTRTEDVTIETEKTYAETLAEVKKKYPKADITPVSIYQAEGKQTKNISFHLIFH